MEDAMIISKSAFERGFGHGCVYKSEHIDLKYVLRNTQTQVSQNFYLVHMQFLALVLVHLHDEKCVLFQTNE